MRRGARLTIGQLARLAGVRPSALRYYDAIGLLPPAGRHAGRRWYDESSLRRLAAIELWQQAGLRLDEMTILMATRPGMAERRTAILARLAELEAWMSAAERAKSLLEHALGCPSELLDDCPHYQAAITAHAERLARGDPPNARRAPKQRLGSPVRERDRELLQPP